MLNNVVLMGRLVADPELRTTQSGLEVVSFTIAIDRNYASNGERQTDFIPCVAWRQTANFIHNYFNKGSMIAVTGSLQSRSYEDKNGNKRTAYEVQVNQASFCGSKAESGTRSNPAPAQPNPFADQAPSFTNSTPSDFEVITPDDSGDLPF